jgi:hypothetical protein
VKSANGVLVLVLGILSIVGFSCLTGIPAWIVGRSSLKEIDSGRADPNERGMVVAGMVLGIIATVATTLFFCAWAAVVLGVVSLAAWGPK